MDDLLAFILFVVLIWQIIAFTRLKSRIASWHEDTQMLSANLSNLQKRVEELVRLLKAQPDSVANTAAKPTPAANVQTPAAKPDAPTKTPVKPASSPAPLPEKIPAQVAVRTPATQPGVTAASSAIINAATKAQTIAAATANRPPAPVPGYVKESPLSQPPSPKGVTNIEQNSPATITANYFKFEDKIDEFNTKAADILRRIWSWIIIGEEFRKPGVSAEFAIATTWLVRISILLILGGVAFFIKYSADNNLVSPSFRLISCAAAALAVLLWAIKLISGQYRLVAVGMMALSVGMFYFVLYYSAMNYHYISPLLAFAGMLVVTLFSSLLALRYNTMLIAILGLIGGYMTPVMLSTGEKNLTGLFIYLTMLSAGSLFIARFRAWHLQGYLSFIGTTVLYVGGSYKFFTPCAVDFYTISGFGLLFFIIYSIIPLWYNVVKKLNITLLELIFMTINTGVFLLNNIPRANAYLPDGCSAFLPLVVAGYFIAAIFYLHKRQVQDKKLLLFLLSGSCSALGIAVPLAFDGEWMITAWALQAVTMLYLGMRFTNKALFGLAYLLYYLTGFMVIKLNLYDLSTSGNYLDLLQQRFFSLGAFAIALGAGCFISQKFSLNWEQKTASRSDDGLKTVSEIFYYSALIFAVVFCYLEFKSLAHLFFQPLQILLQGTLISLASLLLLWRYRRKQQVWDLCGGLVFLLIFLIQLAAVEIPFWHRHSSALWYHSTLIRLPEFLILVGVLSSGYLFLRPIQGNMAVIRKFFAVSALSVWFIYSSYEVYFLLKFFLPKFISGGISIWWGVFGFLLLLYGLRKNIFSLRLSALILLAATAIKVIFIDLSHQDIIYRVIALIAIGLITLGGALIYIRSRIQQKTEKVE